MTDLDSIDLIYSLKFTIVIQQILSISQMTKSTWLNTPANRAFVRLLPRLVLWPQRAIKNFLKQGTSTRLSLSL